MAGLLLRRVRLEGRLVDLRAGPGGVEAIGPDLAAASGEEILDGRAGAVIPGLHDHHLHLLAIAAARSSVRVGPPDVLDVAALARALATPTAVCPTARGYGPSVTTSRWPVRSTALCSTAWCPGGRPGCSAGLAPSGVVSRSSPSPGSSPKRGERYRVEADPDDLPHLYPCRTLLDDGVPVGGSTDAPFGSADPWLAIRAAATRLTAGGAVLGPGERIPAARALNLFLTRAEQPGGPLRTVAAGQPADLVVLNDTIDRVLAEPDAGHVVATIRDRRVIHSG